MKNVNTGYMVRAPTFGKLHPLQLNTAAPQHITQRGDSRRTMGGFFHTQKQNQTILTAAKRQKVRTIWNFSTAQ